MSDQLSKPLYGQFSFQLSADRAATARNLYLGGDSLAPTVTSNAVDINAALSSSFYFEDSGNTAATVSGMKEGQEITVIFKAVGGSRTPSFPSVIGTVSAVAQNVASIFRIYKVKSHMFLTQTSLGSYT